MEKNKQIIIFIIILIFIAAIVVSLPRIFFSYLAPGEHFYTYPLHTDEWQHYTLALSLKKNFFKPHIFYYEEDTPFFDGSLPFHWLIYLFQKMGLTPKNFLILPILQAIFFAIVFFFFTTTLFNPLVGFFASLFALFIRGDVSILGILFFKPYILGFAFLILSLFILHKKKYFSISSIIFSLVTIFCYPPLFLPLIIYILIYILINQKINKKFLWKIIALALLTLFFGIYATRKNYSLLIDKIIYRDSIMGYGGVNLIKYLGVPLIILGLLGIIKTIKNKKLWPLHALFGFFVLDFLLLMITKSSIGFHYMRIIYLGSWIFTIYAAYGLWCIFNWLKKKIKWGAVIIVALIALATIFPTLKFYVSSRSYANPAIHSAWLEENNLKALEFLNNLPDKNKKLLHPITLGTVITPMTGFKVTALPTALIGGKRNRYYDIRDDFTCDNIENITKEEGYELLWLEESIDCSFLKLIFKNNSVFIYEYIPASD